MWISNYGDWEGGGTDVQRKLSELSIIFLCVCVIVLYLSFLSL